MDGSVAIERNRVALKCIVAALVAMAALTQGVGATTLPRHLYLAILRLLRPAESAARRLIIALALTATPQARKEESLTVPPPRFRKPQPETIAPLMRSLGLAVMASPADVARAAAAARRAADIRPARPRTWTLPLFDPLRHPFRLARRYVPAHAAPRILFPGIAEPYSLPPPPSRNDPVNAMRLGQRLVALTAALDDLWGQARRFARWKAARDAAGAQSKNRDAQERPARFRRISPLRGGRPPGGRLYRFDPLARRPSRIREVDEILAHAHALAVYALECPDTS